MDIQVIIPWRNEPLIDKTVKDILDHSESDIIVSPIQDKGRGQRAITRETVERSKAKYIIKTDAHCSFSQGFDTTLLDLMDDKTILAPLLMPLDPISWAVNGKKQMAQFIFDRELVMQHQDGEAGETMCLQGSFFMVSRENYLNWDLDGDDMPSWGGQGVELGIKAFLNDGRCMTTDKAYYGHVFRMEDKDFPYDRGENPGKEATEILKKKYSKLIEPLFKKHAI